MDSIEEIIYSPVICYKIINHSNGGYGLKVYYEGNESDTSNSRCFIAEDLCECKNDIINLASHIAQNCVLPEYMEDVVEDYLQFI